MEQNHNRKECFSDPIYASKFVIFLFVFVIMVRNFFYPYFSVRIRHPPSAGIRSAFYRHPVQCAALFPCRVRNAAEYRLNEVYYVCFQLFVYGFIILAEKVGLSKI